MGYLILRAQPVTLGDDWGDYWQLLTAGVPLPSTIQQIKDESAAANRKAG